MASVLIVDDEPIVGYSFRRLLDSKQIEVYIAETGTEGFRQYKDLKPDIVILDQQLPDTTGLEVFQRIHAIDPKTPVILITAHGTAETAIEAMRLGAFDYLIKPLDYDQIKDLITRALDAARLMEPASILPSSAQDDRIVGRASAIQEMCKVIGRVAPTDATVLIKGESGVGKELVARALYHNSRRSSLPFLAINCAAFPEALLESEMFGHEKGAFTGADRRRIGKFEQCQGGTLFLDEIGDMPLALQAKMLRVLQDQRFERLGGTETIQTNVRLIAATNADLNRKVEAREFRMDLYYRLRVVSIRVPPLRDRQEDIAELANAFLFRFNNQLGTRYMGIATDAITLLERHSWPGNVRELQSVIKEAMVRGSGPYLVSGDLISILKEISDFPHGDFDTKKEQGITPPELLERHSLLNSEIEQLNVQRLLEESLEKATPGVYHTVMEQVERLVLTRVLQHTGGHQAQASDILGINRTTLRNRLRDLGITVGRVVVEEHD